MSEWVPLLSSSTDDFELALLRSTDDDELGAEGLLRAAAALGLGASLVLPTVTASPLAVTALRLPVWHLVVKWLGLGMLGGVTLSGTALLIGSSSPEVLATAPISTARGAAPATKAAVVAVELPTELGAPFPAAARSSSPGSRSIPSEAPIVIERAPPSTTASSMAAFAPLVEQGASENANSIAAQIQMVESARQALTANRPRDALRSIDEYRARWPSGTLMPEATVLGVRAKKILGDTSGAERDGQAFIALYPNSRYAAQLRALLGITRAQ